MYLITRRKGSQRKSQPTQLEFEHNSAGQGGVDFLTLESENMYYMIHFESQEEMRALLSHAHIVHHNFYDELQKKELKASMGITE